MNIAFLSLSNSSGLYVGDLLFILVSFIILMILVGKYAWKPVAKMMEKRRLKVTNDLDKASELQKKARYLAQKKEIELRNSNLEAKKIIADAKSIGESKREEIIHKTQDEVKNLKEIAQNDIKQMNIDALNNAKNEIANLSINIASRLIDKDLSLEDHKKLIDEYIQKLGDLDDSKEL